MPQVRVLCSYRDYTFFTSPPIQEDLRALFLDDLKQAVALLPALRKDVEIFHVRCGPAFEEELQDLNVSLL